MEYRVFTKTISKSRESCKPTLRKKLSVWSVCLHLPSLSSYGCVASPLSCLHDSLWSVFSISSPVCGWKI